MGAEAYERKRNVSLGLPGDDAATLARNAYMGALALMQDHPEEAIPGFERFELWASRELRPDHPYVAQSMVRRAACHARMGHQEVACRLYNQILAILADRIGTQHSTYATVADYVAAACGHDKPRGGPVVAPQHLASVPVLNPYVGGVNADSVRTEEGRQRKLLSTLGLQCPAAGTSRSSEDESLYRLGLLMEEFGEFEIASWMFEDYQAWATKHRGADHDDVLRSVNHRAYCQLQLGDYADSCNLYQLELDMLRRTHPSHPQIEVRAKQIPERCPPCDPRWWFAIGLRWAAFKRSQDAIGAFEAYECWASSHYGDGHAYVVQALFQRAHCHKDMGHVGQACRLFSKVLELADEDTWTPLGKDGTYENFDMAPVAQAYIAEHGAEAASPVDRAWDLHEAWVPPSTALVEPELRDIGYTLSANQHWEEALSAFEGSEAWVVRTHGPVELRAHALAGQAGCWVAFGDRSHARELYEEALRQVPENSPAADDLRQWLENLAQTEP